MRELLRVQSVVFCITLGALAGAALSTATLGRWALERHRAEHPGEYVCGMFMHPYLFLGLLAGGAVGAAVGWRIQRRLAGRWGRHASSLP
jgi:hypothetical protein